MVSTPPPSVDVEMPDADAVVSTKSNLCLPSASDGLGFEDVDEKQSTPPSQQLTSLENIKLEAPATGTEPGTMTRRSARNSNKPRPVLVASPTRPAKRKIVTRVSAAKKAPRWTADKLLTDHKSPLASADLRAILCRPAAWNILSKDERAEIIALFPQGTRIIDEGTEDARPDFDALRNDDNFRHDCATYSENIAQGRHDPEWLEQAWAARERRRAGDFDNYLAQKFEDEWNCELPKEFKPNRGPEVPTEEKEVQAEATKSGTWIKIDMTALLEEAADRDVAVRSEKGVSSTEDSKKTEENAVVKSTTSIESTLAETCQVRIGSPVSERVEKAGKEDEAEAEADVERKSPVNDQPKDTRPAK